MSDDNKPPKITGRFRLISGGKEALPEIEGQVLQWEDLELWGLQFVFKASDEKPNIEEIIINGVPYYLEPVDENQPLQDGGALDDPESDVFVFKPPGPKLVR